MYLNQLFKQNNIISLNDSCCSGYYIFDKEWVKISGKQNYRFSLIDTMSKEVIADVIYSDETKEKLYEFLKQATFNKNIKAITTDLDPKFELIIEKLGFKHQLCIVHSKRTFNRKLKNKNLSKKKEHKKAQKQLKRVTDIFDYTDYETANNEL